MDDTTLLLRQLFDHETYTYTYLVADRETGHAALIDPVVGHQARDQALLRQLGLELRAVFDTHVHADHVTASGALRQATGCHIVASASGAPCATHRLVHGERYALGGLEVQALATPGHTPDSMSFRVGDELFTGDALLIGATGRTDFQGGDARALYHSITEVLFVQGDGCRVWPGHDYRGLTVSTVGEERRFNPRVAGKSEAEFVHIMETLELPPPKHIARAVPLNQQCGCEAGA